MKQPPPDTARVALLYPGDDAARRLRDPAASRYAALFDAFAAAGLPAVPVVYDDAWAEAAREQLLAVDAVLVWHNPIEGGRPRARLDALLRDVAAAGVLVSSHPDTILALGTKDVLLATRALPFGSDCQRIDDLAQMAAELPARLQGGPRVLKQWRGHSGIGVWKVEALPAGQLRLRHAQRGSGVVETDWAGLAERMVPYFEAGGHLIDQVWQPRLREGMWRAYMVEDRVAGFGHQAINALHPEHAEPGQRLYASADAHEFQALRQCLEGGWITQLRDSVGLQPAQLPLLWDADFLRGTDDGWVLCEVNVSSVSPFPPSALTPLVTATAARLRTTMRGHG
jgi:hypothetical protein